MTQEFSVRWDMELNKAYRQGYLAGAMGLESNHCPYVADMSAAAWEAGWEDGNTANQSVVVKSTMSRA